LCKFGCSGIFFCVQWARGEWVMAMMGSPHKCADVQVRREYFLFFGLALSGK
jgi:hypothetical protein